MVAPTYPRIVCVHSRRVRGTSVSMLTLLLILLIVVLLFGGIGYGYRGRRGL
jgi:hypothetical protein